MRGLLAAACKDLRRRLNDPLAILLWVGIPLAITLLFTLAFSGADRGEAPRVALLVSDEDSSAASGLLAAALQQGPLAELFDVEAVDLERGRALMDRGEASALLVIPEGFGKDLLDGRRAHLRLVKNPAQTILPQLAEETIETIALGASYVETAFARPLGMIRGQVSEEGDPDVETVQTVAAEIDRVIRRLAPYLLPPALELRTPVPADGPQTAEKDEPAASSIGAIFFPGMLFMALFFACQSLSEDLWTERLSGTLARAAQAPAGLATLLAGKLIAGGLLMGLITLVGMLGAAAWLGVPASSILPATVWATVSGTALLAALLFLQSYASSPRAGSLLVSLVGFPLLLVGGSFFPFELMPDSLAHIGRLTPNGWALSIFRDVCADGADWPSLLAALMTLAAGAAGALILATRRARRIAGAG